jgi:hypothetical protein
MPSASTRSRAPCCHAELERRSGEAPGRQRLPARAHGGACDPARAASRREDRSLRLRAALDRVRDKLGRGERGARSARSSTAAGSPTCRSARCPSRDARARPARSSLRRPRSAALPRRAREGACPDGLAFQPRHDRDARASWSAPPATPSPTGSARSIPRGCAPPIFSPSTPNHFDAVEVQLHLLPHSAPARAGA